MARPFGTKNRPDPLKEAISAAFPPTPKKRPKSEQYKGEKRISLGLDAISHACLWIHAKRRGVPMTWLVQDILNLWLANTTDYSQGVYQDMLPKNARAARTPERFAGYISSLGFQDEPQSQAPIQPPPLPTAETSGVPFINNAPQVPLPQRSLLDMLQPYRHPLTQGPASYAHPGPSLPQGAGLFSPDEHNRIAPNPGHGSAAQEAMDRPAQAPEEPPLSEEVKRYLDYYRIDPETVR
jgi:hypothetical protein